MADRQYKRFAGQSVSNAGYHNHNLDLYQEGNELRDVSFPSLAAAIAAIGSARKTLYITTIQAVAAKTTIPANISIIGLMGGGFNIPAGVILTVAGPFDAGIYQIFFGAGTVAFTGSLARWTYPQWYGSSSASSGAFSGAMAVTGPITGDSAGIDASAALQLISTQPSIRISETDATADKKEWGMTAQGGVLAFFTRTDALGVGGVWLSVGRTLAAVSQINLAGGSGTLNLGSAGNATNVLGSFSVAEASGFTGLLTGVKGVFSNDFTLGASSLVAGAALAYNAGTGAMSFNPTTLAVAPNININAAVDTVGYRLNIVSGWISTNGTFGFRSFGIGAPSDVAAGNSEYIEMRHAGGSDAVIIVGKSGSGSYRQLLIGVGGTTALGIDTSQVSTFSGEVKLAAANTVNASVSSVVTNKIKMVVNGTTYYLLASTSNA